MSFSIAKRFVSSDPDLCPLTITISKVMNILANQEADKNTLFGVVDNKLMYYKQLKEEAVNYKVTFNVSNGLKSKLFEDFYELVVKEPEAPKTSNTKKQEKKQEPKKKEETKKEATPAPKINFTFVPKKKVELAPPPMPVVADGVEKKPVRLFITEIKRDGNTTIMFN